MGKDDLSRGAYIILGIIGISIIIFGYIVLD